MPNPVLPPAPGRYGPILAVPLAALTIYRFVALAGPTSSFNPARLGWVMVEARYKRDGSGPN